MTQHQKGGFSGPLDLTQKAVDLVTAIRQRNQENSHQGSATLVWDGTDISINVHRDLSIEIKEEDSEINSNLSKVKRQPIAAGQVYRKCPRGGHGEWIDVVIVGVTGSNLPDQAELKTWERLEETFHDEAGGSYHVYTNDDGMIHTLARAYSPRIKEAHVAYRDIGTNRCFIKRIDQFFRYGFVLKGHARWLKIEEISRSSADYFYLTLGQAFGETENKEIGLTSYTVGKLVAQSGVKGALTTYGLSEMDLNIPEGEQPLGLRVSKFKVDEPVILIPDKPILSPATVRAGQLIRHRNHTLKAPHEYRVLGHVDDRSNGPVVLDHLGKDDRLFTHEETGHIYRLTLDKDYGVYYAECVEESDSEKPTLLAGAHIAYVSTDDPHGRWLRSLYHFTEDRFTLMRNPLWRTLEYNKNSVGLRLKSGSERITLVRFWKELYTSGIFDQIQDGPLGNILEAGDLHLLEFDWPDLEESLLGIKYVEQA